MQPPYWLTGYALYTLFEPDFECDSNVIRFKVSRRSILPQAGFYVCHLFVGRFHQYFTSHPPNRIEHQATRLGPPVVVYYLFWGEGSPTKIDYRKKWYPYSNLSTGGPTRRWSFVMSCCRRSGRHFELIPLKDQPGRLRVHFTFYQWLHVKQTIKYICIIHCKTGPHFNHEP